MIEKLKTVTVDFHGLMDLIGCYSEDRWSKKWMFGIQPKNEYFNVNQNPDGTFTIQGGAESFQALEK